MASVASRRLTISWRCSGSRAATRQIRSSRAAHRVDLQHLGRRLERLDRLRQPALGQRQHHERLDRMAELGRIDLGAESGHDPAPLELGQARLHGPPRDPQPARDLEQAEARVVAQLGDQPGVKVVDRTGQYDHNLAALADRSGQIDCRSYAPLHAEPLGCCTADMFEEGQLYSPVSAGKDGQVTVHLADDHPGAGDPDYQCSPERHSCPGACLEARAAGAPGPLQRGRAGGLAHRRARARAQARPPGDRRVPRRQGRSRPAHRRRAEPRPGQRAAAPADRLPLRARRRPGPAARVLRLALTPALPLDPVRASPRQPALHARAGHHPRGRRPRAPARDPDVLRAAPADRRGDPPADATRRTCASSRASSGSRSSSASSSSTAS